MRTVVKLVASTIVGTIAAGGLGTAAYAAGPAVSGVTPKNGTTGVAVGVHPTISYTDVVDSTAMRYSFVKTSGGATVASYYAYDSPTHTFTFTPRAALAEQTKYTMTVKVSTSTYTWSFTTGVTDKTAPSVPGAPGVTAVTTTGATVSWGASTDAVGVTGYQVFDNGTLMATVTGTSTTLAGLEPTTAHSITVKALDAAKNTSAASVPVAFTTLTPPPAPDTAAPSAPGTPVASALTSTGVTLTWAASTDNVGVSQYTLNGGPTVLTSTVNSVTLTGLSPLTAYAFSVQASDAAANTSAASASTVVTTPATPIANSVNGAGIPGSTGKTLVLYDSTGPYGFLGELYAMAAVNLSSHFGDWTAQPVTSYAAGEIGQFQAVVYLGSTYDEPLPLAFLDDVTATTKPVVWIYDNIWQLTARDPNFVARRGFTYSSFDVSSVSTVNYKSKSFIRDPQNGAGIMNTTISDATKATPVASAVRADGTTLPWGVRSGNFTYIGEIPFSYISADDRYVAFADMLFDSLAPATTERHRALVRIEDVGPDAEPSELRAITNYLSGKGIPFSVAVYSRYRDPLGTNTGGVAEDYTLADRPLVVAELKYMQSHGGTLLMHGYTHQYESMINPYNGVSADDFEFYTAHVDAVTNNVVYDGPVPSDSQAWAQSRIDGAFAAFAAAGLTKPTIFEFPHYAGSDLSNKAVAATFQTRYDRGLYSSGAMRGGTLDNSRIFGQFFPYTVRDIYGVVTVPENIGNIELEPFNNHPAHLSQDIIESAQLNLAVRDGVASFFFHPYVATSYLQETVEGIQAAGYTFVPASSM